MTAKDKLIFCILAIVSVAAVSIEYEIIETAEGSLSTAYAVLASFRGWGIGHFLFAVCLACIYCHAFKRFLFQKDTAVLAFLLAMLMLMGLCYRNATGMMLAVNSVAQIIKSGLVLLGYGTMFYCAILFLRVWLSRFLSELGRETGDGEGAEKHYRLKTAVFLLACWSPYLVALYPGTTLYDAGTMLEQFYGYAPLTNHHPYFQILLFGVFVEAGNSLGSGAAGMFVYVLLQVGGFIAVLSYLFYFIRSIGVPERARRFLLSLYAFLPVFPVYAVSVGKNMNFSIVILLLTVYLFEIFLSAEDFVRNRKKMILLPALLTLVCLFRNEGLAIVIGCFPCFIVLAKRYWKVFSGIFAGVFLFVAIWFKWILPYAGVASGSVAESLSIPFLQTARSVCYYGSEMTQEEIEAIDRVLEFDTLPERYLPEFSDRVKERYNNDATKEEIDAYLKVYLKQFFEHPVTYIDAFLNKCYGYFYPDDRGRTKAWFVVGADVSTLNRDGFDLESRFPAFVKWLNDFLEAFREVPLIGYTTSIGFYSWCVFLTMFFVMKSKRKRIITIFVPAFLVLLICAASPVNAYFRYGLPVVFSVPFFAAIGIYVMMSEEGKRYLAKE